MVHVSGPFSKPNPFRLRNYFEENIELRKPQKILSNGMIFGAIPAPAEWRNLSRHDTLTDQHEIILVYIRS